MMRWYVVHVYSGFEKSVQRALLERITRSEMQDKFGQILVPVEEVVEMSKHGKRKGKGGFAVSTLLSDDGDFFHCIIL